MAGVLAVDLLSGLLAGVNVTLVGHPFETIKVRLQTDSSGVYKGTVDCVKKTLQWEGPAGLYKGVTAPLAGQLFFRSAMFWANSSAVRFLSDGGKTPLSYTQFAMAGSFSWASCTLIEAPLQVASSQFQTQIVKQRSDPKFVPEYKSVLQYYAQAPRKYGLRALYAGIVPHLCRNVPGGFFHFGAFEYCRREYAKSVGKPVTDVGLVVNMVSGSIGGFLFWALTYPADVIKSAIQGDALDPAQRKYKGAVDAATKLWAEGGVSRFTRGLVPCLLRSVPANAVLLTTAFRVKEIGYDYLKTNNIK